MVMVVTGVVVIVMTDSSGDGGVWCNGDWCSGDDW